MQKRRIAAGRERFNPQCLSPTPRLNPTNAPTINTAPATVIHPGKCANNTKSQTPANTTLI
jgi:hypothetical protein